MRRRLAPREAKRKTASPDRQMAHLWDSEEIEDSPGTEAPSVKPVFKLVDTCAAEVEAVTPYTIFHSEDEDEARVGDNAPCGDPGRAARTGPVRDRVRYC